MPAALVPTPADQQENSIQAADQVQNTQQQASHYEELLKQDSLTPSLRARIETAKRICEAALVFQHREPNSMSNTLSDLDDEINNHWECLYRSPSTSMIISKDMADLRHFLARCLNMDYGCSHEDLGVECWPPHAASQYGRYLRDPEGYNRATRMCLGRPDDDEGMFATTRTLTVSAEACIDTAYALKQVESFKERRGKWNPFALLLASEGRWKELAEKVLADKAHLPYIYPDLPSTQPRFRDPANNPRYIMRSKIMGVQYQYFWKLNSPDDFRLTKEAKTMDRKRRLDELVARQLLVGCRQRMRDTLTRLWGALTRQYPDGEKLSAY